MCVRACVRACVLASARVCVCLCVRVCAGWGGGGGARVCVFTCFVFTLFLTVARSFLSSLGLISSLTERTNKISHHYKTDCVGAV